MRPDAGLLDKEYLDVGENSVLTIRHIKSSEGGVNKDGTVYFLLANIKVDIELSIREISCRF